ncbi:MAG: hypothetical protein ACF8R9_02140 [Phycisphaerales bacterium JB054]
MQLLLRRTETKSVTDAFDAAAESSDRGAMDRLGLVQRIMALNPTASREYLGSFTDRSLSMYLAHLESAGAPRGARWERPCDSPAIIGRESAE